MLYLMIENVKVNGVIYQEYIEAILAELPKRRADDCLGDSMTWGFSGRRQG
ncbi:MAG: hypothetical protein ACI8XV_003167 [Arenicella sp.]|jgi:hypothetical protein